MFKALKSIIKICSPYLVFSMAMNQMIQPLINAIFYPFYFSCLFSIFFLFCAFYALFAPFCPFSPEMNGKFMLKVKNSSVPISIDLHF